MVFKDHFTKQSDRYAKYRPNYPDRLFEFLASVSPSKELAWDCATGNGQAANGLAKYFAKVIASDGSEKQIKNAALSEKIIYKVFPAEKAEIKSSTVDLITVAQALHWFNFDKFYLEAKRVLKESGVIAAWMYDLIKVSPEIDLITKKFDKKILVKYWPAERRLYYDHYESIPFPFERINAPTFEMLADWTLENLLGYLSTWSAVQKYREVENSDPLNLIRNDLLKAWGQDETRRASWDLVLKIGRV